MPDSIAFYFDFSSPYGYLASTQIEDLAARHGRTVDWRPILLGVVFQATGSRPLIGVPLKGDYARRDLERWARLYGVPFTLPPAFPFVSAAAARAVYWLTDRDAAAGRVLAAALYHAAFGEGRDISGADAVATVAASQGHDRDAVLGALQDPAVKERLRAETDAAIARGVFGSPFIVVDDEPFWGNDRLQLVETWLARGGF